MITSLIRSCKPTITACRRSSLPIDPRRFLSATTYLLKRGNWRQRGPEVVPGFLSNIDDRTADIPPPTANARTTGRRSVLANWIARAENPLTARVMVNRVWQHHFGRGIVAT